MEQNKNFSQFTHPHDVGVIDDENSTVKRLKTYVYTTLT